MNVYRKLIIMILIMMMISPPLIDVFLGGVGRGDQINY